MPKNVINQFMWGYQQLFRIGFESFAGRVLTEVDPALKPRAILIGIRSRDGQGLPVCIEPEDGPWELRLFDGLEEDVDNRFASHESQKMMYGDEPSNEIKPRLMRKDAVRQAVQARFDAYDLDYGTVSFAGEAMDKVLDAKIGEALGSYTVVPVLQFDRAAFDRMPRLATTEVEVTPHHRYGVKRSLAEAAIEIVLEEAAKELWHEEPGRHLYKEFRRKAKEVLREAGDDFMLRVGWLSRDPTGVHGLFEACTMIASLRHESASSSGTLVMARRNHPAVSCEVQFANPVPVRNGRWARKMLELASTDLYLLCDTTHIYGLGRLTGTYDVNAEDLFVVRFTAFQTWEIAHAGTTLMRVEFGVPGLPKPRFDSARFIDTARRIFPDMTPEDAERVWSVVDAAGEQKKGALVVISGNAAAEAERLGPQATPIAPRVLTPELVRKLTAIDGAVLLDPHGHCHAIGVILDGMATDVGKPERGARYNSAIRYVMGTAATMAVIVSEDRTFEVLPILPLRVRRSELDAVLSELHEAVAAKNWDRLPQIRRGLERYRFYFSAEQCEAINADLDALRTLVTTAGELWVRHDGVRATSGNE
jgi:DisA bacterial checkpoint controller nucleotide-binding